MADKIKQVADAMDMLAEDSSIPRNIRKGAQEAKNRLLNQKEALDVRASSAMNILADLTNDPNIPMHANVQILNILSQLEQIARN